MKRKVKAKLFNSAGESIGETLVALLISALALLMLAGAISSAARLVTRNSTLMNEYYVKSSAGSDSQQKGLYDKWKVIAVNNIQ